MKKHKRTLCLLLAALLLVSLAPDRAAAADTVYFTAVNDQLLPLSDETMPFWSGGLLYVASTAFDGNDLGIFYSRSRDKLTAVLYTQRGSAMICDFSAGTIYDSSSKRSLGGSAIARGDVVFLPLDVVCRFFGLEYSTLRISYGYLVRVKNGSVVLSDASFIDAASATMAQRYARYERAKESAASEPEVSAPAGGGTAAEPSPRTVYFALEATDPAAAARLLDRDDLDAVFLFAPHRVSDMGDVLRRLAAGAGAVALRVDASGGSENTLAQIVDGNGALWAAAAVKTRLVRLDGADEETLRAIEAAGYCPLRFALDYGDASASASRMSARILSAADANGGSCRVFLGADAAAEETLNALLAALRSGNCTPARLNEAML